MRTAATLVVIIATDEYSAPYIRPALPDVVSGDKDPDSVADPQGRKLAEENSSKNELEVESSR